VSNHKPTVDVIIPSSGRASLAGIYSAWTNLANNEHDIGVRIIVVQDGKFQLPNGARNSKWSVKKHTGNPGFLVGNAIHGSTADYVVHGFDDDPPSNIHQLVLRCHETRADWCSSKVEELREDRQPATIYDGIPGDYLLHRNTVPLQGCVFRRSLFKRIQFFEPDTPFWRYDHDFVLRLHLTGATHTHVDSICGWWVINPEGITSTISDRGYSMVWQDRRSDVWKQYRG